MSEYHVVETEFKDEECLIGALEEMGYKPTIHATPKQLEGYQGKQREQKAHIIIPRTQVGRASNDVGFEKVQGKYITHASQFDHAWRTGKRIGQLKQTYSERVIMKTVSKHSRYSFSTRKVDEKGNIKIKAKVRII